MAGAGSIFLPGFQVPKASMSILARLTHAEMSADVVILGGGVGGCATALAAARNGKRVIMTEETDWIGGQFTAQGLAAPDEHAFIESHGRTRSYATYRNLVRDYYRNHYPLTGNAC